MNIFTFSEVAWDDKNSFGNTISNWFFGKEWSSDYFFNFYCRSQLPDNSLNVDYYCLTLIDIIKGTFRFKIKGKEFSSNEIEKMRTNQNNSAEIEKRRIDRFHKKKNKWIYYINDLVWMSKIWLNNSFKSFVQERKPDIFFAFAYSPASLWSVISYLKKNTNCKIVLFIADNVRGSFSGYKRLRRSVNTKLLDKCINAADKLYAVSDEMSELYSNIYRRKVTTLYKGCDLSSKLKSKTNNPIIFTYAGNLLWGRDDTLSIVAKSIEKLNRNGVRAKLKVYSGATITPELEKKLSIPNASELMGSRTYGEIKQILHDSDVVLHVESFEEDTKELVKYSFSTKITDCLQSGSQVFGIGPKDIASIEYIRKVDGAIVVDEIDSIQNAISHIVDNNHAAPWRSCSEASGSQPLS